jgi:hypothetical protein
MRPIHLARLTVVPLLAACPPAAVVEPAKVQSPATVIEWAMGESQRLAPTSTAHHRLVLLSPAADAPPSNAGPEQCSAATQFLPAPPGDARIFFLIGGEVHGWRTPLTEPVRLEGNDARLGITRLLAFARNTTPPQMLVAAQAGTNGEQLYELTLTEAGIQGRAPVKLELAGWPAFFARYRAPRCLDGGRRCLTVSQDSLAYYIDEKADVDSQPKTLRKVGKEQVADVRWGPDGRLLALVACP